MRRHPHRLQQRAIRFCIAASGLFFAVVFATVVVFRIRNWSTDEVVGWTRVQNYAGIEGDAGITSSGDIIAGFERTDVRDLFHNNVPPPTLPAETSWQHIRAAGLIDSHYVDARADVRLGRFQFRHRATANTSETFVTAPAWAIITLSAAASVFTAVLLRRKHVPGHCRRCGYDLRMTPDRCPECGMVVTSITGTAKA